MSQQRPSLFDKMMRQRSLLTEVGGGSMEVAQKMLLLSEPAGNGVSSSSSSSSSSRLLWRHRVENFLWLASTAFIIYYGDFRSNFFSLLAHDPRVRRMPLLFGLACLMLDISIFLYLAIRLRTLNRIQEKLDVLAPGAIPTATMVGLAAFILFSIALWPIWNILTVPMLFTLFMACIVVLPYFPPYWNVKVDADSLNCLCIRIE